jgi:hypothetical protein
LRRRAPPLPRSRPPTLAPVVAVPHVTSSSLAPPPESAFATPSKPFSCIRRTPPGHPLAPAVQYLFLLQLRCDCFKNATCAKWRTMGYGILRAIVPVQSPECSWKRPCTQLSVALHDRSSLVPKPGWPRGSPRRFGFWKETAHQHADVQSSVALVASSQLMSQGDRTHHHAISLRA